MPARALLPRHVEHGAVSCGILFHGPFYDQRGDVRMLT